MIGQHLGEVDEYHVALKAIHDDWKPYEKDQYEKIRKDNMQYLFSWIDKLADKINHE